MPDRYQLPERAAKADKLLCRLLLGFWLTTTAEIIYGTIPQNSPTTSLLTYAILLRYDTDDMTSVS